MIDLNLFARKLQLQHIMVLFCVLVMGSTGLVGCQKIQWFDSPIPVVGTTDSPDMTTKNSP